MITTPKISILMPVYNGEKYLHTGMKCLLDQTFRDFELLIMDDGSTDRTAQILEAYGKKDRRIKIFQQKNSGIVKSLNVLASHAKAEIIARMDVDDIAYPEWLQIEYDYLQKNPKTVVLGATCIVFRDDTSRTNLSDTFCEDFLVRWFLTFDCAIRHSAVMYRKETFMKAGGYWQSENLAEEYGLWIRMKNFGEIENLKNILAEVRMNTGGISGKNFRKQMKMRNHLNAVNFEDLYRNNQLPDLKKVTETLQEYMMTRHRIQIFAKLACLTGCFLVEKGEIQRAIPYFKWSFQMSKKRLDAVANLVLVHYKKAIYISLDRYIRLKTLTLQIRRFRTNQAPKKILILNH